MTLPTDLKVFLVGSNYDRITEKNISLPTTDLSIYLFTFPCVQDDLIYLASTLAKFWVFFTRTRLYP